MYDCDVTYVYGILKPLTNYNCTKFLCYVITLIMVILLLKVEVILQPNVSEAYL